MADQQRQEALDRLKKAMNDKRQDAQTTKAHHAARDQITQTQHNAATSSQEKLAVDRKAMESRSASTPAAAQTTKQNHAKTDALKNSLSNMQASVSKNTADSNLQGKMQSRKNALGQASKFDAMHKNKNSDRLAMAARRRAQQKATTTSYG